MKTSINIRSGLVAIPLVILMLFLFSANSAFANTPQASPVRLNHAISSEQVKHADSFMLAKGQWQYRSTGKPESSNC